MRHFKAATGRLPAAYVQALRVEAAKAMLEHDDQPIQASPATSATTTSPSSAASSNAPPMTPGEYRAHFAPLSVRGQAELEASQLN